MRHFLVTGMGAPALSLATLVLAGCASDAQLKATDSEAVSSSPTSTTASSVAEAGRTSAAGASVMSSAGGAGSAQRPSVGSSSTNTGGAGAAAAQSGAVPVAGVVPNTGSSGVGGVLAQSGAAGSPMQSGSAGAPMPAGAGAPAAHEDLGKGDGRDVVCIGDSWMSLGATGIQQSLIAQSGQQYRAYGVPGTRLLDEVIPNQYESAKRESSDIKTVVMTGGGNDVLGGASSDRAMAGPMARGVIDMIADRLVKLWTEMGQDGVEDVVYIQYSRGGQSEAAVNYATEKIQPLCEASAPTRCHYIDSDIYIMKMLMGDGIHPTNASYDKIAKAVLDLMEKEGLRR